MKEIWDSGHRYNLTLMTREDRGDDTTDDTQLIRYKERGAAAKAATPSAGVGANSVVGEGKGESEAGSAWRGGGEAAQVAGRWRRGGNGGGTTGTEGGDEGGDEGSGDEGGDKGGDKGGNEGGDEGDDDEGGEGGEGNGARAALRWAARAMGRRGRRRGRR